MDARGPCRVALVAETVADAREVLVEGESGLLAKQRPWNPVTYEPSKRRLTWSNGAIATTYSGDRPGQLRGPQHDIAWVDELAKYRYPDECWYNLELGLRLGKDPRTVVTTTPRPIPIVRRLLADERTVANPTGSVAVTRGSTYDNSENLPRRFLDNIRKRHEGTRLGRQELHAELLDDNPAALWKRGPMIEAHRVRIAEDPTGRKTPAELAIESCPPLVRVVVAVDPAVTSNEESDETGIVVVGLGQDRELYVLDDRSGIYTPWEWANASVNAYKDFEADCIVAEVNNGGDLVETNVRTVSRSVPYKKIHASRGKRTRAEPVAGLYERGIVHHVGSFPQLEDQLCNWNPITDEDSPDRLDANVWGCTEVAGIQHEDRTARRRGRYVPTA